MRTTVTLDDALLARAEQLCGDLERSALLKDALRALVQRKCARRLAALRGSVVLVDTSAWVAYLRHGLPLLATLLQDGEVLIHPWVIGELACGNLRNRSEVLSLLRGLPAATLASDQEVLLLIEREQLMGRLSHSNLWTQDRRLAAVVEEQGFNVSAREPP